MAEDEQARGQGQYEGLEVLEGAVARAADIGSGEEAEDVLGGLGELPELESRGAISLQQATNRCAAGQFQETIALCFHLPTSSTGHQRGYGGPRRGGRCPS